MGSEGSNLHMLFFPLMVPGHMLPMVDIAKLAATRGVRATILSTPANANHIHHNIELANASLPIPIRLRCVPFPSEAFGLPTGCENLSSLTSDDKKANMFEAIATLRQPFDDVLVELRPDCVVTDMFLPWTYEVAAARGIPRLVFHGTNCFAMCALHNMEQSKLLEVSLLPDASEKFVVPGLPRRIEMLRSQMLDNSNGPPVLTELLNHGKEADRKSFGVVVNTFYELEPEYIEYYTKVIGFRAWHIGPVSLSNGSATDMSARGSGVVQEDDACLKWLDGQEPGSVIYVCFGSMCMFTAAQLREMALGLEASGHPFVMVVRMVVAGGGEEWMPEGFEERVKGRGMVMRGWAPQMLILNHQATGGFVTHCGWNSSLEGISSGLPMVTWPLFAEQFFNEKFLVDVLEVGVAVGVKDLAVRQEKRKEVVGAAAVEAAVRAVMGEGEEADGRRRRARALGEKARRAVEKGGSSYEDMGKLIQELTDRQRDQQHLLQVETCE